MNLVFDTNIYLAAMGSPKGLCQQVLKTVCYRDNGYFLHASPAIIEEVKNASGRLVKKQIIDESTFQLIMKLILASVFLVKPAEKIKAVKEDPKDDKILECAIAAKAHLIITMDRHLLKIKNFRNIGIIHPKTFTYMFPK